MVKTLSGKTITLDINGHNTVSDLNNMLQDIEGVPPDTQRIYILGRVWPNSATMDHIGLKGGDTITINLSLKGGSEQDEAIDLHETDQPHNLTTSDRPHNQSCISDEEDSSSDNPITQTHEVDKTDATDRTDDQCPIPPEAYIDPESQIYTSWIQPLRTNGIAVPGEHRRPGRQISTNG